MPPENAGAAAAVKGFAASCTWEIFPVLANCLPSLPLILLAWYATIATCPYQPGTKGEVMSLPPTPGEYRWLPFSAARATDDALRVAARATVLRVSAQADDASRRKVFIQTAPNELNSFNGLLEKCTLQNVSVQYRPNCALLDPKCVRNLSQWRDMNHPECGGFPRQITPSNEDRP